MFDLIPVHQLVNTVISVLDARDPYTYEHSWRVAHIADLITQKMNCDKDWSILLHMAARLHDIGKVGVHDNILNKEGALEINEFNIMKAHPRIGFNIVNKIEILKETANCILHHHERWDGTGYPDQLQGEEIPLGSRIIAIADCFDAMTSERSYRGAKSVEEAFAEIKRVRGTQLCPDVVDTFLTTEDKMEEFLKYLNAHIEHQAFNDEEYSFMNRTTAIMV